METRFVIWTPAVREKLIEFRNSRFTPEETLDFISQLILETEDLLKNPLIVKSLYRGIRKIPIILMSTYTQDLKPFDCPSIALKNSSVLLHKIISIILLN